MTTPPNVDPVHAVLDRGLHQLAGLGGDLIAHANSIGTILWSPPRVVIVGRLKAGKSTLVNALIGAPVAETAALEATNVVTVYQDGSPSRAEVVGVDGRRHPVAVHPHESIRLPLETPDIAFVDRWLPSTALRQRTLIDTPGLSTLTVANDSATRRAMIGASGATGNVIGASGATGNVTGATGNSTDGFEQTRAASVDADAAVFLFDAAPRADEVEFISQLPFTPLTMLGVLSRADSFGEGALGRRDPLTHAAEHATTMATHLNETVDTVVPISGLMAQTSHTGALTEQLAAALAGLRGLSRLDVVRVFDNDDAAAEAILPRPLRIRLLELLGEYGVLNGRHIAAGGAAALNAWLADRSGIGGLYRELDASMARFAILHRAHRILARLDQLSYRHPARDHIRALTAQMRSAPELNPVIALEDYQRMLRTDPHAAVTAELHTILTATSPAGRVGLPSDAPRHAVTAEAHRRLAVAQQRSLATASAAEDAALITLIRTYTPLTTG
ncbi:dynamin family protein [Gordonia insulae]|uniref:Isoniazid-induced protein IniC n=1 Tax=Gordonia insulae TaxID=2420509 RepID=A0A3G8JP62_9ACTN|nr:dynamin family protein [Gordonia insulae]AZG46871.1 Isoniazid-induced protein IniC [Gordonia insulae]